MSEEKKLRKINSKVVIKEIEDGLKLIEFRDKEGLILSSDQLYVTEELARSDIQRIRKLFRNRMLKIEVLTSDKNQ